MKILLDTDSNLRSIAISRFQRTKTFCLACARLRTYTLSKRERERVLLNSNGWPWNERKSFVPFSYPLDDCCFERVIKIEGEGEKKEGEEKRKERKERKKKKRERKRCANNAFETVKELIRGERLVYAIASTLKNLRIVLSIFSSSSSPHVAGSPLLGYRIPWVNRLSRVYNSVQDSLLENKSDMYRILEIYSIN